MSKNKLEILSEIEGIPIEDLLEQSVMDIGTKGICMNPDCTYTTEVEPDQSEGFCELCKTNTVKSCLILAGLI